jgi:hypothetical protein
MGELTCFISKFLNTNDIDNVASKDPVIENYLGCYPADVPPNNVLRKCWLKLVKVL